MSRKPNAESSSLGYVEVPLTFNSVETIPNLNASAAFQVDSGKVFKEDTDIVPVIVTVLSGYKEGSKAFQRFRDIDEEMKKDLVKLLD